MINTRRQLDTFNAGFSTLELLIAFAVLTISLTAVIMVAFGNQSIVIDTELAQRALYIAEEKLEEASVDAKEDFDSVTDSATPAAPGELFSTKFDVYSISECAKRLRSEVSWDRGARDLNLDLETIVIDSEISAALNGLCATTGADDEWDNPGEFIAEQVTGQAGATSIQTFNDIVYLTTEPTSAGKDDFFIYDFDPNAITLTLRSSLNTDSSEAIGLRDIDVTKLESGEVIAFVASASTTAQLGIIDVSDPDNPVELWQIQLPGVSGSDAGGRQVYYYDEQLYVATHQTSGDEFHIFDASSLPSSAPTYLGSLEIDASINDMMIRGDYAYLATTDDDFELMVIDISDATNLEHPNVTELGFDAPEGGDNDGTAVFANGDAIYLGRERDAATPPDNFFILDPTAVLDDTDTDDGILGSKEVGLQNNALIAGIVVNDRFAFLALDDPNTGLIIYNIEDPNDIFLPAACSEYNFSENTRAITMDLDSQFAFTANRSNSDIQIIHDKPTSCDL